MDASNYDPMAALDMEKRTGIKHADIDDFLERAKAVEQKIEDIRSGKISVEQLAAEQEAELRAKRDAEAAKIKRLAEIAEREKLRRAKEKAEERESWWRGADAMYGDGDDEPSDAIERDDADESAKDARLRKYENDYGRWNEGRWTPKDPATLEEEAAVEKEKTDKENAVFEKNNKEFCDNFMADMEVREKSKQKKDDTATATRLKGNRYFKAKKYDDALRLYRESLGVRPYEKTTLLNVAQVFLKMALWDDALEFAKRAVVVSRREGPDFHAKALARRAAALERTGDLDGAAADLDDALALLKHQTHAAAEDARCAVLRQLKIVEQARRAAAAEARAVDEAAALAEAAAGAPQLSDAEKTKRDSEELLAARRSRQRGERDDGHFQHDAATRASACELVAELAAADGASDRARGLLAAHLPLLRRVAALASAGGPALARRRQAKAALPEVAAAAHALKCLRDLADDEAARATLLRVGDEGDVAVVEAVAVAAKAAVSVKAADRAATARAAAKTHAKNPMAAMGDPAAMCEAIAGELADYGCACLAHLAFSEQFRPAFAVAVAGARDARATPAGILLAAARDAGEAPEVRASALAAVTNACLGAEGAVQAAEAAGGVAVAYAFVRAPPAAGDDVRARAAGLRA
ncbi:hypothetical protein JL721_13138 [Aureococcus anophagefferens]|nr:hypothetical protein JL721_13138 [Aureococcus anophagefferens]